MALSPLAGRARRSERRALSKALSSGLDKCGSGSMDFSSVGLGWTVSQQRCARHH
jgi:hypothetical protein